MKRWLDPTDPSHETFWSVDEEGRFWLEDGTDFTPAEPPQELIDRHQTWIESRSKPA